MPPELMPGAVLAEATKQPASPLCLVLVAILCAAMGWFKIAALGEKASHYVGGIMAFVMAALLLVVAIVRLITE